jgi:DNA-binding NtrC family response regulator
MIPEHPILIVDDESNILKSFKITLKYSGMNNILTCQDSRDVMGLLSRQPVEMVMLDLMMPYLPGEELLLKIVENYPEIPVIIITAANDVDTAVRCIKHGAMDYMVKPVERNRLVSGVNRVLELNGLKRENLLLKNRILNHNLDDPDAFSRIVTKNDKMLSIFKYMEAIAGSAEPVLITGETGVGKELFASALHTLSRRKGGFVSVNVAGVDDNVFSDTLFGHSRGAFTDAHQSRSGLVEQALEGTLFLDEIGDLSEASQIKLLRLLQEKTYYPLGSDVQKESNVRILFSTNRSLEELIKFGTFRKDLYFRIHIHHIQIPPLRERLDDLPLLVNHFLHEAAISMEKKRPEVNSEILSYLSTYTFPGNIRELKAMIYDAVSRSTSSNLSLRLFKKVMKSHSRPFDKIAPTLINAELDFSNFAQLPLLKLVEDSLIKEALSRARGNVSKAAQMLGLTRQTLSKRLKSRQIDPKQA